MKNSRKYRTESKKQYRKLNWKKKVQRRKEEKLAAQRLQEELKQNPGSHPSNEENQLTIVKFCKKENLVLLPDEVGEGFYESYSAKTNGVLPSLDRLSKALEDTFNSLEGVTCDKANDGMYLYPRIQFPQEAIKAADALKIAPDAFYAQRLLEATGIIASPGSDFGQVPGIWFVGLSIPIQEETIQQEEIPVFIARLSDFHRAFMAEFHD